MEPLPPAARTDAQRNSGFGGYLRKFRTSILGTSAEKAPSGQPPRQLVRSSTGALPTPRTAPRSQPESNRNSAPITTTEKQLKDTTTATLLRSKSSTGFADYKDIHLDKHSYSDDRLEAFTRITIQQYCHICRTRFGAGRECPSCSHAYCQDCIRRPEQETDPSTAQSTTSSSLAGTKRRASPYNSFDTPRSAPTVRKVHRTCHRCSTPFIFSERICQECDHLQCTKCPRRPISSAHDPVAAKNERNSYTQPHTHTHASEKRMRERTYKKPRQRIRFTCDRCGGLFREKNRRCDNCGHQRCDDCLRAP